MGSNSEGTESSERWWENPKLSPADLRHHSESWSLADDAAMATLLQSISQSLVSRTHEVEGALERVLEEADRVVTTIANTNNAFHMLANTQFIENRTYQDDADIAREKQGLSEKVAVTEEDILTRCRKAIVDGLSLANRCYERHEIHDSDSEDDGSPSSPVPIYALIDPYENRPLPLIIGSEGFLADDKVGLEISSSEENSRMTFSPEDTDSEGEMENEAERVIPTKKSIPASSSRMLDDDTDSEWSDEDSSPATLSAAVNKQKPVIQLSSDEEDEMFIPKSRNSSRVSNNLPHYNKGSTITSTVVNSEKVPAKTSNGVENIRAMPDATRTKVLAANEPKKKESLFASDSDDEGDLFSSKPHSAGCDSDRQEKEESHSQPGKSERKVPVGGVSIFGSAITSALCHQHLSDSEPSEDEPNRAPSPTPSKTQADTGNKTTRNIKSSGISGLFDSDDDGETLFDPFIKQATATAEKSCLNTVSPSSQSNRKTDEGSEFAPKFNGKKSMANSTAGLFSDDDDIFGITAEAANKRATVPQPKAPAVNESLAETTQVHNAADKGMLKPEPLLLPTEQSGVVSASESVTVPELSKTFNNSLFSSPSDDDDIFSSVMKVTVKTKRASAFMTDPPPLPPQSITSKAEARDRDLKQLYMDNASDSGRSPQVTVERNSKESPPNSLFSCPSDEDMFSSLPTPKYSQSITSTQAGREKSESSNSNLDTSTIESAKVTNFPGIDLNAGLFDASHNGSSESSAQSPSDNSKQLETVKRGENLSVVVSASVSRSDIDITEEPSLSSSLLAAAADYDADNDLFGVTQRPSLLSGLPREEKDFMNVLKSKLQPSKGFETPSATASENVINSTVITVNDKNADHELNEEAILLPDPSTSQTEHGCSANYGKPLESVKKAPVGGVALFGRQELTDQISNRKSVIESPETEAKATTQKVRKQSLDKVQDLVTKGEDHKEIMVCDATSEDVIFDTSRGDYGQSCCDWIQKDTHPMLPEEIDSNMFSKKHDSLMDQEKKIEKKHINPGEFKQPKTTFKPSVNQEKLPNEKSEGGSSEEREKKEIIHRKKPPIGGVSMFGGSELFAKVQQRKSMLAYDSDSSEEDTPSRSNPSSETIEEEITRSPNLVMPRSPLSPTSHFPQAFTPKSPIPKLGGEEVSVNFDDPATTINTLPSLNKSRVRGSLKRRPPSRAHRKSGVDEETSHVPESTTSSPVTPSTSVLTSNPVSQEVTALMRNSESNIAQDRLRSPPIESASRKVPQGTKENEVEPLVMNTDFYTKTKGSDICAIIGESAEASNEGAIKTVALTNTKDVHEPPESAFNSSDYNSEHKTENNSLFESDSDEDLFGDGKQTQSLNENLGSSGAAVAPKLTGKNSTSHSLFGDDDEDSIFSPTQTVDKVALGVSKNSASTAKPKSNLKQSNEPFEDPLLGSFK